MLCQEKAQRQEVECKRGLRKSVSVENTIDTTNSSPKNISQRVQSVSQTTICRLRAYQGKVLCAQVTLRNDKFESNRLLPFLFLKDKERAGRGRRRMMEGVNSTKIYFKRICKYHSVQLLYVNKIILKRIKI
jgi:hypothetical protein